MAKQTTTTATIQRESLTSFAARMYGCNDLRSFKSVFKQEDWNKLKAMNPKGRWITPNQIRFIYEKLGKPEND